MAKHIFETYQDRKNGIITLAKKAKELGSITEKTYKDVIAKVDNDVLTIGIIGQMKCGKSTFLNAFVFEDDTLPAASTPMTASLCIITYGEEKYIEAEFYTQEEWNDLKIQANRNPEDFQNEVEKGKIKTAKELMEASEKMGAEITKLLGTTKKDKFENLAEYSAENSKYIAITKAVKIYYPKEYLKGIQIVDTPGMNDPIVFREERTKEFLNKADAVILMLYTGRPFDATDKKILFDNILKCGVGKVVIGVNKYDVEYGNGKLDEEGIKKYIEEEIRKASQDYDDYIKEIMEKTNKYLLSSQMALLSKLKAEKIQNSYKESYNHLCGMFEISSPKELYEKSYMQKICDEIFNIIEKEKCEILFNKPINQIKAEINLKIEDKERELAIEKNKIALLKSSDDEIEKKSHDLNRAYKKVDRKLESLQEDLKDVYVERIGKGVKSLNDIMFETCDDMHRKIDEKNLLDNKEETRYKLDNKMTELAHKLMASRNNTVLSLKKELKNEVLDFSDQMFSIFDKYLKDIDMLDFIDGIKNKIGFSIDENVNEYLENIFEKDDFFKSIGARIKEMISPNSNINEFKNKILDFKKNFKAHDYFLSAEKEKEEVLEKIKKEFFDELLDPMLKQVEECKEEIKQREENLKSAEEKIKYLEQQKQIFVNQKEEIFALANSL